MRMMGLLKWSAPRLGLLLALALALGGLFFLFDLFRGLISSGPSDILAVNNSVGETSQIPSGAGFVAVLAPAMCFVLSGVTALLMWRWLTSREHKRLWIIVLGGLPAFTLLGLGVYLAIFGPTIGGLFYGEVPYDQHPVEVAGVKPLGLALLAAFLLSVVFVAITRPILLPIPMVLWLVAALFTGMFQSNAIYGLNLFTHPSRLEPTAAYASAVERYRPVEIKQPTIDIPAIETPAIETPAIQRIVKEFKHVPGLQDPAGTIPEPVGEERLPGLETFQFLVDAVWDVNEDVRKEAVATLEALDADVIPLETGGFIVSSDELDFWAPGATAFRSPKPDTIEVFQVTGADHSGYLRTGVGVSYADGRWRQDNSNRISYVAGTQPRGLVIERLLGVSQPDVSLSELTISPEYWGALLAWPDQNAIGQFIQDEVTVSSIGPEETVPAGVLPVSLGVRQASFDGSYLPWEATFEAESGLVAYRWTSRVPQFSLDELKRANLAPGTTYLGLPLDLPNRITQLALEITSEAESPYLKAKAIEEYLRNNYTYAFAEPNNGGPLPEQDPVDWFLFDEPEGTCGQFSSAFVILARSVGIPARIVSGWVVGEVGVTQTVYSDQAHQWAEVPFEGLGWVTFEPSAQGAAPFRAPVLSVWEDEFQRLVEVLLSGDKEEDRAEAASRLLEIASILDSPTGRVLEPLVEALIADDSEMVQAAAIDALGLLVDARAIGPLIDRLANDEQPTVREAVANSLANFGGPEVLEALVEAFADEDERVRGAVAEALGDLGDPAAFPPLLHALSDDYPRVRESAAAGLRKLGTDVTGLENGKYVISQESGPITVFGGGASTSQASKGERFSVFKVGGALHTGYLRDGVGDLYQDGRWAQIDLLELPYDANESIGDLGVSSERLKGQSRGRFNPPRWVPERIRPAEDHEDEITLSPVYAGPSDLGIPEGVIPTSLQLERVAVPGVYRPYSSTFVANDPAPGLTWTSRIPIFSEAQLTQAKPAEAGGYLQLPDDLPPRIRELALEFKRDYDNPYLRARAIENYLKTDYSYAYSQPGGPRLPAGQDPVDWFLFESKEGTCGQFSSAFVLLARSAGIPARVVTGWAIGDVEVSQAVYSDQAHQWAEVPFENLGWVTFEPTASGSARSRAPEQQVWTDELRLLAGLLTNSPDADLRAEAAGELANLSEKATLSNLSITRQLITSMGNDDDARVRAAGAHALGEIGHRDSIPALHDALTDDDSGVREAARDALERSGATSIPLESGASVLSLNDATLRFNSGTSTAQATKPPHIPVMEVRGASHTNYLRTGVGDVYENGSWSVLNPVVLPYRRNTDISSLERSLSGSYGVRHRPPRPSSKFVDTQQFFEPRISISPARPAPFFQPGTLPISLFPHSVGVNGDYRPFSSTFSSQETQVSYSWVSRVTILKEGHLVQAKPFHFPGSTNLPDGLPDRIHKLSVEITTRHEGPYLKAKAIETFLRTHYAYAFANSNEDRVPEGRDPVDWFLFDHLKGTCGQFSSAFVLLARSVGIPARVASGWLIDDVHETQTVYTDQAHQWAEVALDGLGWVTFEPTASGGAPARTPGSGEGQGNRPDPSTGETQPPNGSANGSANGNANGGAKTGSLLDAMEAHDPDAAALAKAFLGGLGGADSGVLESAAKLLSSDIESVRTTAEEALDSLGAKVTPLETGGSVISMGGQSYGSPGTSTGQAAEPDAVPVFQVTGAGNTSYLRTSTGEFYANGRWTQLDPFELTYGGLKDVRHLVNKELSTRSKDVSVAPVRPETALLAWPNEVPAGNYHQSDLTVSSHTQAGDFPPGVLPISYHLDRAEPDGSYRPFSATFRGVSPQSEYSWRTRVPLFSQDQLARAKTIDDPAYRQLPDNLPRFIRGLAEEITWGLPGPYAKAKAIETYLKTHYTYAFAVPGDQPPPRGRDPVAWFLQESGKGTCGQFSSAFVLLARSVGIPARVVSGWAIDQTQGTQTVLSSQAHQWAEVGFSDLGWVTFEPTAAGGAPSRTSSQQTELVPAPVPAPESPRSPIPGPVSAQPPAKQGTVTEIIEWPARTRKGVPFSVGGSVVSESGGLVDGIEIEIFVNVNKENGGIEVGSGTTADGKFEVELRIPRTFTAGSYQLIAHAIANETYTESWSDPEIGVYSTTGLEFTGPAEIAVDVPAKFSGRLTQDDGEPVDNREVQVQVDGRNLELVSTDENGMFEFANTFEAAGERTVEVEFEEQDFMLGVSASLAVSVTMPTALVLDVPGAIGLDQEFSVGGALRDIRGNSLANHTVLLSLNSSASEPSETNGQGEFLFGLSVDRPGVHTVDAVFVGLGNFEPSESTLTFVVTEPVSLQISGEGPARVGEEYVVNGSLADSRGNPMVHRTVAISTNSLPDTTVQTDAQGQLRLTRTFDRRGIYPTEARFASDGFLQSATSSITVKVTEPVSLRLTGGGDAHVGKDLLIDGALQDAGGNPLAQQTVTVFLNDQVLAPVESDSQGAFQLRLASVQPGKHSVEAVFQGGNLLEPASSQISFKATEPVFMRITGDKVVRVGETYHLTGVLSGPDDRPLPGMPLTIEAEGRSRSVLDTDSRGGFSWETIFNEETRTTVKVEFPGNNELGPALVHWPMLVGVPEIVVEPLEPVARGDFLTLRGVVVIGPQTMKDIAMTINGEDATRSNAAGTFVVRHAVPGDSPLGKMEIELAASELEAATTVEAVVKSATSIIVSPLERVRPGHLLPVEVKLLNDQGLGIPNVPVHYGQSTPATTGPGGVATVTIQTPADESLSAVPLTLRFGGDDANLPLTYFVGLPVTPVSFNWLLWVGLPALVVVGTAGGFLGGRRRQRIPLPPEQNAKVMRPIPGPVSSDLEQTLITAELLGPVRTMFEVHFPDPVSDRDPVWKTREPAVIVCALFDETGLPLVRAPIDVTWPDSESPVRLTTDERGLCESSWTGYSTGDYHVRTEFPGNDDYLAASAVREFRLYAPIRTQLEMRFPDADSATDPVWKTGEQVLVVCTLVDEAGIPLSGMPVDITWPDSELPEPLATDREGKCEAYWSGDSRGDYQVRAEFHGNDLYLPASAVREFRLHAPIPTHIEISLDKSADDLPNIWGVGEELMMVFTLLDESGEAVIDRKVEAIIGNDHAVRVVTGSQGTCNATWIVEGPGAYTVTADFQGDENYLPSSARSEFEVVRFREDVVQRYNAFLDWVRARVPDVSTQATPREMEALVVASGLFLDQRSLEIVISRFEEADYSEHDIERRQFEAMYRAWRNIVGD